MTDRRACWVHYTGKPVARGFVHAKGIGRKYIRARIVIKDEEFEATIPKAAFLPRQLTQKLDNRFIGISKRLRVHVCTCRWSKADLIAADKRADRIWKKLRIE